MSSNKGIKICANLAFYGRTDKGIKYKHNEDFIIYPINLDIEILNRLGCLFILCDGIGGSNAGEVASELMATWVFKDYYSIQSIKKNALSSTIIEIIKNNNKKIFDLSNRYSQYNGMGTTLVATLIIDNDCYIYSVGDSRVYLYRNETLSQVTEDQSEVWDLYKNGLITKDEIRTHPRNNIITMAIGMSNDVEINQKKINIKSNDILIMSSDGLTDMLSDDMIEKILQKSKTPHQAVNLLINKANKRGGKDNISVICIFVI